jgi:hypothetical protein
MSSTLHATYPTTLAAATLVVVACRVQRNERIRNIRRIANRRIRPRDVVTDCGNDVVVAAWGPSIGTNYDDVTTQAGRWCVSSSGTYEVVIRDS